MKDLSQIARPIELSDGRVRLRGVLEKDRAATVGALNDPLAGRFLSQPPFPYLDEHFDDWLALAADGRGLHETLAVHWTIADAADDSYLGGASLEIAADRGVGEIGYQVAPWARGRGVATAASRMIRDWAFDELEIERLEIAADVDNVASQRVARAAGFSNEGTARAYLDARGVRRDHVLFGMVRGDPRRPCTPLPWPCLDDGRVVVRPFEAGDAEALTAAFQDPDIQRWMWGVPQPFTREDGERFVKTARRHLVAGRHALLAVADSADDAFLGHVSLEPTWNLQKGELGYWVRREARRRGVATAAARLTIRWAFEELALERLELQTYPGNSVSQRLAEALGFRREGLLRGVLPIDPGKDRTGRVEPGPDGSLPPRDDQVLFALLKYDWPRAHPVVQSRLRTGR